MKFSRAFSLREKVLMAILAVLLLVALYLFAVQMPVSEGIASANAQIADYEMQNNILDAKLEKLNKMKEELAQIDTGEDASIVPEYDNLKNVMSFLNKTLASTTDYSLDFSQVERGKDDGIVRRNCKLSFKCSSYSQAKRIVESLENCEYIFQVNNLVITPVSNRYSTDNNFSGGPVSVSLTGTFFERT